MARRLILPLALLLAWASAGLAQPTEITSGDWTYTLNQSNEATITAYSGVGGAVVIPATIDGYAVKVVGADWPPIFGEGNSTVTSVTIPDIVTGIKSYAFYECTSLTSVTIGSGVAGIGGNAFNYCSSLTSVSFLGNAPNDPGNVFDGISPVGTVYYLEGTTGWGETYSGWPTYMLPASAAAKLWRAIGQTDVTTNPSAFNLFTQNQYDANRTNGIAEGRADVTNNPAAYSLFTQSQYDTHHSNGVTEGMGIILSNAASYGLYDSNSIMDLNLGGVMVQKAGANAEVVLQLQTAEDLASGFTNSGPPITNSVPMNGNKGFMRIRALGNQ